MRPGQSAVVSSSGREVGSVGRLDEELAADYKFKQPVYVAEIDLQALLDQDVPTILYHSLPKYPSVVRDVSLLVSRAVSYGEVKASILAQGRELCRNVEFVDIYEGKGMDPDKRSLTIRLEYRSDERTLIETEVDGVHGELIETLENDLNIQRRF
jgi:phenylalanyl-tRNA synthetase beta chain